MTKVKLSLLQELLFRQHLDCHVASKLLILCLIDLAHAAFAQLASDLIMPERLADHEESSSTSTAGAM